MSEQLRNRIEQSWLASATPEERRELLDMLLQNEQTLKDDSSKEFDNNIALNLQYLPDEEMQEVFGKICEQLGLENMAMVSKGKVKRINVYRWVAAVAAVLIIAAGFYWYNFLQASSAALAISAESNMIDTWQNNTTEEQVRILEDGSRVVLSPESRLRYLRHFNSNKRLITLSGTASFQVAKDSTRPFTVYAGNLATTALGTRFLIDMSNDSTQIKLFEGKVVVRDTAGSSRLEVYLLPGEQLNFDNIHKKLFTDSEEVSIKLSGTGGGAQPSPKIKYKNMEFAQTPIAEVFSALAKRYKVRFEYNEEQISSEFVTGKFMADEQLNSVLKILETINGFSFQRKGDTIIVTK